MGSFGRSKDDSKALEAMRRNTRLGIAAVAAFALGYVAYATGGLAGFGGGGANDDEYSSHIVTELRCPPPSSASATPKLGAVSTKRLVRAARAAGTGCGDRPRTVVTMSSFYGRHTSLPMVVRSILDQSHAGRDLPFLSLVPLIDREFRHNKSRAVGDRSAPSRTCSRR
ncbi:hypothetical protein JL720_6568 [Aureococcus anophagefferens]|nr:hypothetical protein JL720_6568 [Aureococcus anophagefferens]